MKKEKLAYVFVLLAALLWASTPAVGKLMIKELSNIQVLLFISFIATLSLFIIVLVNGKLKLIKKYKKKDYFTFAYMGFIGIFLYNILFYGALMFSSAQEAFIINYTWPVWVTIFSIFILKDKFTIKKLIAILLGFIGVYLVVTKGDLLSFSVQNIQGILLAAVGAISYGLFSVLGKKKTYDTFVSMMFYYLFTFIFTLITVLLFSHIPSININQFYGLLWLGVFTAGLAFVFWFSALKYGDTTKMANMIFLTPFLSLVYIYFLTGEKILTSSIAGLIIIILGILLQSFKRKK